MTEILTGHPLETDDMQTRRSGRVAVVLDEDVARTGARVPPGQRGWWTPVNRLRFFDGWEPSVFMTHKGEKAFAQPVKAAPA